MSHLKQALHNNFSLDINSSSEYIPSKKMITKKAKVKSVKTNFLDFSDQLLWVGILLLSLFTFLGLWLFKKIRQEKKVNL